MCAKIRPAAVGVGTSSYSGLRSPRQRMATESTRMSEKKSVTKRLQPACAHQRRRELPPMVTRGSGRAAATATTEEGRVDGGRWRECACIADFSTP